MTRLKHVHLRTLMLFYGKGMSPLAASQYSVNGADISLQSLAPGTAASNAVGDVERG